MSKYQGWDPINGGVSLAFGKEEQKPLEVFVHVHDLIELRDDLTEAIHEPRGCSALDVMVKDILPNDLIYVLGKTYTVNGLLAQGASEPDELEWVVQFTDGSYSPVRTEVVLPGDQQVTVYRNPDRARL